MSFGEELRRRRVKTGLTQEELAERAGVSVRGLSDLERNVRQAPYRDTVERLAAALGLDDMERSALLESRRRVVGRADEPRPLSRRRLANSLSGVGPLHNLPIELTRLIGREHVTLSEYRRSSG
ncbi:MAG: helix-turn-helix domain-containing protein [Chloroflexota bacterium]|nr:helix-turn-helix domain-containing protein [Chloroflexota bacterium]